MTQSVDNEARVVYNKGWQPDGSWHCPKCHTMIGRNLLGQRPCMLAFQHAEQCNGIFVPQQTERICGPFPLKISS